MGAIKITQVTDYIWDYYIPSGDRKSWYGIWCLSVREACSAVPMLSPRLLLLLLSRFSVSNSVRPHRRQPTRLPRPWDSPGKNTGVGCHFLLQYMKVKSESEVAQSCPTLSNPMDCSLPGSSIHGIFQARVLEWGATAFSSLHGYQAYSSKFTENARGSFLLKMESVQPVPFLLHL